MNLETVFNFRVTNELRTELERQAKIDRRNLSDYVRLLIEDGLSSKNELAQLRADLSAAQARIAALEKVVSEARNIIEQAAPVIKDDIDAAGVCDHSVGICMCGVVSLYETIQEYLNPAMKQERERHDAEMLEAWHERL